MNKIGLRIKVPAEIEVRSHIRNMSDCDEIATSEKNDVKICDNFPETGDEQTVVEEPKEKESNLVSGSLDSDTCDNSVKTETLNCDEVIENSENEITKNNNSTAGVERNILLENSESNYRPASLSLPLPLQHTEHSASSSSFEELEPESPSVSLERLESVIQAVTEIPLHEQGVLMKDGNMMSFVAEDLNEMIRMSSPLSRSSRTNSIRSISSINSISSSSYCSTSVSGMSRSSSLPLHPSPDDIPPIDPHALKDIETHAKRVADNLDLMMGNLRSTLHKMSAITIACGNSYSNGVDNTCESVDTCIKSMYALMAKCEEMSKVMQPVYKVAEQIKEIKRLLDLFEGQMAKDKDEKSSKTKK